MKKHILTVLILILCLTLCALVFVSCKKDAEAVEFSQREYELKNGDKVSASGKKVTYVLATKVDGVSLDEDSGRISIAASVPDCTQVVVLVKADGQVKDRAICTLRTSTETPQIVFDSLSDYVLSGETVRATSTPAYSVYYSLQQEYAGIAINSVSGKITYSSKVADGTEFVVVATAKGVSSQHTFKTVVGNCVTVQQPLQISEFQHGNDVTYVLDYAENPQAEEAGVLQVVKGRTPIDAENWQYDKQTKTLTVKAAATADMAMGDNTLKIVTAKNSVTVTVRVATYLATAQDIAAINSSRDALAGYYIMVCDIDLTEYLSKTGEGYNSGKGWNPIGVYHDVADGTATDWAFAGTFDGNGHTISGFFIDRIDEFAYNSGFFGYITSRGEIRNLGIKNAPGKVNYVRSYSGGFAGVNAGKIENCWADVSVETGEVFKVVGGFVGRNEGEIINCYSLGSVSGGSDVGSFAGVSVTEVARGTFENCYAVQTGTFAFADTYNQTNGVFASKSDMAENADFSAYPQDVWKIVANTLPSLKSTAIDYDLKEIKIVNTQTKYTRGDVVDIEIRTNPQNKLHEIEIVYEVLEGDAECMYVDETGAHINTRQFLSELSHFKICATCGDLKTYYEFDVYERVSTIRFDDTMEHTLYAGTSYYLDVTVLPDNADNTVEFTLVTAPKGVTISDGILTVSPYVSDGAVQVEAVSVNGKTATLNAQVVANKNIADNYKIIYRGETDSITYQLPAGIGQTVNKVTRYDKAVEYSVSGDQVTIDARYFVDFGTRDVPVKFITTDGDVYVAYAVAYNREDVVEIASVADFMVFKENQALYSKVIVLTADLDFAGATITACGSHHTGWDFTGVFDGNGHTISNLKIDRNDFSGEYIGEDGQLKPDENTYQYHASRFNVGLFSYLTGTVSNVHFVNVTVASYFNGSPNGNFVGVVAGTITGKVTHCTFTDCSAKAGGTVVGVIGGKVDAALIIDCYINGNLYIKP